MDMLCRGSDVAKGGKKPGPVLGELGSRRRERNTLPRECPPKGHGVKLVETCTRRVEVLRMTLLFCTKRTVQKQSFLKQSERGKPPPLPEGVSVLETCWSRV